jgi:hypothetical protein
MLTTLTSVTNAALSETFGKLEKCRIANHGREYFVTSKIPVVLELYSFYGLSYYSFDMYRRGMLKMVSLFKI